jgi:XapX domain-containing protein
VRIYVVALAAGIVVGLFYGCLGVRSPAPPVVALIGLFGILIGEQILPVGQHLLAGPLRRFRAIVGKAFDERDVENLQGISAGMPTTEAETINADLLTFLKS